MDIRPNRLNRGRPEPAQDPARKSTLNHVRLVTETCAALTPEPGCQGWSPLDVARQCLENANVRITELEASLDGMRRTLLRKEAEVDQLRKQIEGTVLPTPPTSNAISALRAAKKRKKRNRR